MAFWGVEIKSDKPYTLQYDDEKGRLHVSQATLGDGSSKEKTVVVCNVGGKKPIYLCSLFPRTMETCSLNVEFEEFEEVMLSVIGPHSVHLSGYFFGESPDDDGHDCDSDSCGDCGLEGESESGASFDYDSEDEDDVSDDDIEMFPPSSAPKSGVRIEEITDDDKPTNENDLSKRPKKNDLSLCTAAQGQLVLKNVDSVPVFESEDEDRFPVSAPAKGGLSSNEEAKKETGPNGQLKRKKTNGDTNNAKRKKTDSPSNCNQEREPSKSVNLPSATSEVIPKEEAKKTKKSKKKRQREKEAKMQEASKSMSQSEATNNQSQVKEKPQVADSIVTEKSQMNEEKKAKKKNKEQENELSNEGEKAEAKSSQTRTFPNGLVIEDLQMGRPDGKRAAAGKKVSVRYIGKLKKNSKIFDSNIGKAPFKFRLGVGEVIKGWDVGVNGMRVGDKRRLIIPPAMGYGAKGAGGAIPPNAWLTFDVELVDAS